MHRDQRASVDLITDEAGNVVDRLAYDPFGARIGSKPPESPAGAPSSKIELGFAGHAQDDEPALALVDMKGRVYDPSQYRFLTTDPLFDGVGSQSLNRYAYLGNNPMGQIDPTGFAEDDDCEPGKCTKIEYPDEDLTSTFFGPHRGPKESKPEPPKKETPSTPPTPPAPPNYDGRDAGMPATGSLSPTPVAYSVFDRVTNGNPRIGPGSVVGVMVAPGAVIGAVQAAPEAMLYVGTRLMVHLPLLIPTGTAIAGGVVGAPSATPAASAALQEGELAVGAMCFAPGTRVAMADGSTKPIEDVRVGDLVLSEKPGVTSPTLSAQRVTALHRNSAGVMIRISIGHDDGDAEIVATAEHPFWTQRGWVEAANLTSADVLVSDEQVPVTVRAVAPESVGTPTFNLTVETTHTFFVVADGLRVLVHNDCNGILIAPYAVLKKALSGSGLQAHHLLPQRFAEILGMDVAEMLAIPVTPGEHPFFTEAWRQLIPYGTTPSAAQVYDAARQVYNGFPTLLKALGL